MVLYFIINPTAEMQEKIVTFFSTVKDVTLPVSNCIGCRRLQYTDNYVI